MPRPFAVIGITFFITLVFLSSINEKAAIIALCLAGLLFIFTICIKSIRRQAVLPAACLAVVAACVLFVTAAYFSYNPAIQLSGENVRISGKIIDLPEKENGRFYYLIKTNTVNGKQNNVKIRFSCAKPLDAQPYDKIETVATVYVLGEKNEDSLQYYKTTGIFLGAYSFSDITITSVKERPVLYYVLELKQKIYNNITELLPNESGGLVIALLLGDKSLLSESTMSDFRDIGISHIVAISGLNLSIFLLIFLDIFERLRLNSRIASVISAFFVLLVMALAGFSASVLRAGFMMFVLLLGKIINKEADSLNSIGLSVLIISLLNPLGAGYIGLQLSFFATLGIILLQKRLMLPFEKTVDKIAHRAFRHLVKFIYETVTVTVASFIFTLPTIILTFKRVALISILSNLMLVYSSTISMISGGLAALLSEIPFISFLRNPLALLSGLMAKYILQCSKILAGIKYSTIGVSDNSYKLWLSGAFILVAFAVLFSKRNQKTYFRLTAILCAFTLFASVVSNGLLNFNVTNITVADVGNASAAIISKGGKTALIGCGGDEFSSYNIVEALQRNNTKALNLLLIPRTASTESQAAANILSLYNARKIILPELSFDLDILSKSKTLQISKRISLQLWKGATIDYLYTDTLSCAYANIDNTTILFIYYPGCDISKIPAGWMKADILVCRAQPPNRIDCSKFKTVVISKDVDSGQIESEHNQLTGDNILSTAARGNIVIKSRGNSVYTVGRDI